MISTTRINAQAAAEIDGEISLRRHAPEHRPRPCERTDENGDGEKQGRRRGQRKQIGLRVRRPDSNHAAFLQYFRFGARFEHARLDSLFKMSLS
jgi:hypothetical protein